VSLLLLLDTWIWRWLKIWRCCRSMGPRIVLTPYSVVTPSQNVMWVVNNVLHIGPLWW
jgi:hypothetical protein